MGGSGIIKIIGALLTGLIFIFGGTIPVDAVSRSIGLEAVGIERAVQVKAPASSVILDFPIPRLAKIQSATATVAVTPSSQLSDETFFFFHYNNKLVSTRTAKELRQQKTFSLQLPVDGIARDFAQLQIKSGMFITDDLCRDSQSGGLFFIVHGTTSLNLTYDMLPVRTVADFFGSFQQDLIVVVPDDATMAEFGPGAWLYGALKKGQPHLNIRLVHAAELAKLPPVPRIWIGLDSKLPKYFKGSDPGITLKDPNTLLISAADVPSLKAYVQQLLDLPKSSLNTKAEKRIEILPIETPSGLVTEAIAFGSNNLQEGLFSVPAEFRLFPILLDKIPERLGFHLEGSHTLPVDAGRPVRMDVFLNSNLVHSSVLDRTGQFKKDILLQEPVELRSSNTLKILFNYPEDLNQCKIRGKFQVAQILPSSYMWGSGQYRFERFDWSNIGLFLGRPATVLIDETLGLDTLKLAGEIAYFLDRQLPTGMAVFPNYLPLQQQSEVPAGGVVLVAGLTGNIPAALQEKMPASIGADFNVYRKGTTTNLFEQQGNVNTVVGRVGENKGAPLVIFSANMDGALLIEAFRHISQPQNAAGLIGNVLVYQQPAKLYSFDVSDKNAKMQKSNEKGFSVAVIWDQYKVLILIALGLLFGMIFFLFRRMFPPRKVKRDSGQTESSKKTLFK